MKLKILKILYYLGVIRVWCFLRRKHVTILTLHGVADENIEAEWVPLRQRTSRQLFDDTLEIAKQYFNFISLDEAVDVLAGKRPVIPNSCVVTFDDGHLNNYSFALPILRKHGIPVVFYPSIKVVDEVLPYWFDRLDYAVQQPMVNNCIVEIDKESISLDQSSRESNARSLSKIIKTLKKNNKSDKAFYKAVENICSYLENISSKSIRDLKPGDPWSSPMSWDDIKACANAEDVLIGSHTVNHYRLPLVDDDQIRSELADSKTALEVRTGVSCDHFCYPNGDWDDRTVRLAKEVGYKSAVTTDVGSNSVGDNLYALKRYSFPVKGAPLKGLFAITGMFHFISQLKNRIQK